MKKLTTIIFAILFFQGLVYSQSCCHYGILLTRQSQIDSFPILHPGCVEIEGDVFIDGSDIKNLNGLNTITTIQGSISISQCDSLNDLSGLENLNYVQEDFGLCCIEGLTSLNGINNLVSVSQRFYVSECSNLLNLEGMDNVVRVGALYVGNNPILTSLEGIGNLTRIDGSLAIVNNRKLLNLSGLRNLDTLLDGFTIWENPALNTLEGLNEMAMFNGPVLIRSNHGLTDISAIDYLDAGTISMLSIIENSQLSQCEIQCVCDLLELSLWSVNICYNAPGCYNKNEVVDACDAVDIDEITQEAGFAIYPNPATNVLNVSPHGDEEIVELNIYGLLGQKVLHLQGFNNKIDISMLTKGVYLIETIGDKRWSRERLIVD
jgi:Secretion system C-terminal sorting domain/Receptor L domain